jgi:hypothetical protein
MLATLPSMHSRKVMCSPPAELREQRAKVFAGATA